MIMVGTPAAFVFGGPVSTLLLGMDGIGGLDGWQWLFVIEGAPVLLLAAAVLRLLRGDGSKPTQTGAAFRDARILRVPSSCSLSSAQFRLLL
jgi:hypothetical protein